MDIEEDLTIIEIRIKNLREKYKYTQNEIAKLMGISRSLICLWEKGYANISLKQIIKLASIYKVPLDYILGIIDNIDNNIQYKYISSLDLNYLGNKIKETRKSLGLTQDKFAKKLDTKRSSISYYEIGKMMISTADLKQICETFGVSSDYLIGNTDTFIFRTKLNKIKVKDIKELITNYKDAKAHLFLITFIFYFF